MNRAERLALIALKKAQAKPKAGAPGRPGADGVTTVIHETKTLPAAPQAVVEGPRGVGVEDFRVEQDGLDLTFVLALDNGEEIRREAELPKPKKGKDGKDSPPILQMRAFTRPTNIVSFAFNVDGKLVITFSDGSTQLSDNALTPAASGSSVPTTMLSDFTVDHDTQALFAQMIEIGGYEVKIGANAVLERV